MGPLFEIILYIIILVGIIVAISFVISVITTFIGIKVVDSVSKKNAQKILPQLPGTNCGQCECEECAQYALTVADERRELGKCPYLSEEAIASINDIFPRKELAERPKLRDAVKGWLGRGK